jgi:hypothetical protein
MFDVLSSMFESDDAHQDPSRSRMKNITSPGLIRLKGILFLLVGLLAAVLLLIENPSFKAAGLLAIAVWCFCRFYYFAFYVIEHYVDSSYRFSGLWSFFRYLTKGNPKR